MADRPEDQQRYHSPVGKVGGVLGRDENGRSAFNIFARESAHRLTLGADDVGEAILNTVFVTGLLGNVVTAIVSAGYGAFSDPDSIQGDPSLTQNFSQSATYMVSQEIESMIAVVRDGERYAVYTVEQSPDDYRLSKGDGETMHRWDLVEDPRIAQLYAADVADTYARTLALIQQHPDADASQFAPVSYSYEEISHRYIEQDGEIYRDAKQPSINTVTGAMIVPHVETQASLWSDIATGITAENYVSAEGSSDYNIVDTDNFGTRFGTAYKNILTYGGLGFVGLSLLGAGVATGSSVSAGRRKRRFNR